ncbi:MAG: D-2-hydroxyacid dehydrogenase [Treponema sp.]|jgi:phosphoglycerate dehydrogenase-like enzyme|nr:D-2-hydroxyacid dehydrogenase [Treponema sp.]
MREIIEKQKGLILVSLSPDRLVPNITELLREAGENRPVLLSTKAAEIEPVLDQIEISMGDPPFALLSRMPRLRWVQLWSAGADLIQRFPELRDLPFRLCSASGIHGQQLTEHVFGLILAWNRGFPAAFAAQKRREWLNTEDRLIRVLSGKTMLILGFGAIGEQIARTSLVFGMTAIGLRRTPSKDSAPPGVRLESAEKLRDFLPQADYVVNILPATPDTRHIFGEPEFCRMKPEALYINVGRGATTGEAALIKALESKQIAGALLDVTEQEPLPAGSPLWDMDNVILTSHYAGRHPEYGRLALDLALENLGRYVRGEPLKNPVDKNRGY